MNDLTQTDAAQPVAANADDVRYMTMALALGRRGLGNTAPNPAVGAVIVKDGVVIARGWTQPGGRPHAETEALSRAKRSAKGATLYVTLEPCSHQGQTPPCVDAIIKAGIARVVAAIEDPNPEVAGQGFARLRESGIAVDVGVGAEEALRDHAGHIRRMREGRPHVMLKLAVSTDGKAGLAGRKRAFISAEDAQPRVFGLRAQSDAIMVGVGTLLADNPNLTCRLPGMFGRSPVRVILDARLRTPLSLSVVATVRETPTWIFCSTKASPVAEDILVQKGVKVFRVDELNGKLDLEAVLKTLAAEGITRLMVEGGPMLAASLVGSGLVDEAVVVRGAKPLGDNAIDALDGMNFDALTGPMRLAAREAVGVDTFETYERA